MRREGIAILLYLAIAAAFFLDAAVGRGAFFHYDTWMQNYAFRAWWFDQLKQGHFATWCPGMFAGYPLFAETQAGPLFPITFVLFLVLPATLAFSWSVILLFALAGTGAHALVRRLGGGLPAALVAGAAFQLAGFLVTHVVHFNLLTGAALLPWALFFSAGLLRRTNRRDALGLAAVAAGYFLGSHPYAILMALFATAFLGASAASRVLAARGAAAIAGAWILGAGVGAIQLLPAIDLLERTPRGAAVDASFLTFGSFPPWGIAALANPDVFGTPVDASFFGGFDWSHYAETCAYVGLLPLALAASAVVLRRDRATFALAALAAASFVMMLGKYTAFARVLELVPVLQSTRLPARWALPFSLAVAALAGLGLDALVREVRAGRRAFAAGAGAVLVVLLAAAAGWMGHEARSPSPELRAGAAWTPTLDRVQRRARESWARTAAAGVVCAGALAAFAGARERRRRRLAFVAPALVAADLASWGASFNPRVPPAFLTSPPPAVGVLPETAPRPRIFRQLVDELWDRVPGAPRTDLFTPGWQGNEATYATGAWALPPNCQILYGVDSGEGFTSLPPLQWLEWMGVPILSGAAARPELSEAQADLLALDAVLSTGTGIAGAGWESRAVGGDVVVSRNRDPLPRARLAAAWAVKARGRILEEVRAPHYDPRLQVLLEEAPLGAPPRGEDPGGAAVGGAPVPDAGAMIPQAARELHPGDWKIVVPAGARGIVVLAESYDPGWRATGPGGERLAIQRADGLFVAFAAPAGGGDVRVTYSPAPVRTGAIVSFLARGAAAALGLPRRRSATPEAEAVPRPNDLGTLAFTAPLAVAALLVAHGVASGSGELHADRERASLIAAAARSWAAEAEGAYRAGAFEAAADLLTRAARAVPRDAGAKFRLGLVRREQGRIEEARRSFREALEIDPRFEAARNALGTLTPVPAAPTGSN